MPDPYGRDDIATARARLRAELAAAREQLEAERRRPLLTDEEKRQLTEVAERGDLGRDMEHFAREVRDGTADWESFVRRTDGREGLFQEFVRRSEEQHADELEEALVTSEPPPEVAGDRPTPWPPVGWQPPSAR